MRLILCRHGNTFGPGDKVVRAGSGEDFPLVEKGLEQAEQIARFIEKKGWHLDALYTSPLKRTHKTAQLITEVLGIDISPTVDFRLNELNYGLWSGLSDNEIQEKCGGEELHAWNERSIWPANANFEPDEQTVKSEVLTFANELLERHQENSNILVVSSNGRLRYFLHLVQAEFDSRIRSGDFKVKTGHICVFEHQQGIWNLISWNNNPTTDGL